MSVELGGDWAKLAEVLSGVARKIENESGKRLGRDLARVEARVLDHLDRQDLDWKELDKGYANRKEEKGLSPDVLRATNQMYQNITLDQPNAFMGMVGVQRGSLSGGGEVVDIALIHEQPENDGEKIPARKLWQPTYEEMKDELGEGFIQSMAGVFAK